MHVLFGLTHWQLFGLQISPLRHMALHVVMLQVAVTHVQVAVSQVAPTDEQVLLQVAALQVIPTHWHVVGSHVSPEAHIDWQLVTLHVDDVWQAPFTQVWPAPQGLLLLQVPQVELF